MSTKEDRVEWLMNHRELWEKDLNIYNVFQKMQEAGLYSGKTVKRDVFDTIWKLIVTLRRPKTK